MWKFTMMKNLYIFVMMAYWGDLVANIFPSSKLIALTTRLLGSRVHLADEL